MSKPHKDEYPTRAEYRWARKQHVRRHGGSLLGTLAVAVFFGAATHSVALFFGLVGFALWATWATRRRDDR